MAMSSYSAMLTTARATLAIVVADPNATSDAFGITYSRHNLDQLRRLIAWLETRVSRASLGQFQRADMRGNP